MTVHKRYTLGIYEWDKIDDVNEIVEKYATITMQSSSHMYFHKQPINPDEVIQDITFFQMESDEKFDEMAKKLKETNIDIILRDEDTKQIVMNVEYGGVLTITFDNVKTIKQDTYAKIDELKHMKNEFGYCKGFKPSFRPMELTSTENEYINPEIFYLISDTAENLEKLKDYLSEKILEIDPDFKIEYRFFKPLYS